MTGAATLAALGTGLAAAASHPTLSMRAKPKIVLYKSATFLEGRLSNGKSGVGITLGQRRWPFSGSFKMAGHTTTGTKGRFVFTKAPSLATQYRATSKKIRSRTATAYVIKSRSILTCVYTRRHYSHQACGEQVGIPRGTYTLRLTVELFYPARVYSKEKTKPVLIYYGERSGALTPPPKLSLRKRTLKQKALSGHATEFTFKTKITIPRGQWAWASNQCTKTTERKDGFGLPGKPGSHGCGKPTVSSSTSPSALG